ncbi:hypothetical protein BSKO_12737 [Bryopsis sp. KO-2023]|nr:hypothetical protein BSKO_12737 [Bryopsis sp. KO-2023]
MGSRSFVNTTFRIELCISLILSLSEGLVAFQSKRELLGAEAVLGEEKLAHFDLPEDVELLLQSESNCPHPVPPRVRARSAVLCGTTLKTRKCLNYTETETLFTVRNCTHDHCVGKDSYQKTACFLESYGISVDIKNKTRRKTCGLDPSDKIWLEPAVNPVALKTNGEVSCDLATPPGVISQIWAECVDGRPELRHHLHFMEERKMLKDRNFTCLINPTCIKGRQEATFLCYAEKDLANGDAELASFGSRDDMNGTGNGCRESALPKLGLILFGMMVAMCC